MSKIYVCEKFYKKFTSTSWSFLKKSLYATWLSQMWKPSLSSNLEDNKKFPERNKNNYFLNDRNQVTFHENPTIRFSTKLKCVNFAPKIAQTGVIWI